MIGVRLEKGLYFLVLNQYCLLDLSILDGSGQEVEN